MWHLFSFNTEQENKPIHFIILHRKLLRYTNYATTFGREEYNFCHAEVLLYDQVFELQYVFQGAWNSSALPMRLNINIRNSRGVIQNLLGYLLTKENNEGQDKRRIYFVLEITFMLRPGSLFRNCHTMTRAKE